MVTKELVYNDESYFIVQFPIIEHRDTFLIKSFPNHYPNSILYIDFWRQQKRYCIEGFWGEQPSGFRWMPPNLYFYVNFGTIEHKKDKRNKAAPRKQVRPELRDVEWEISYNLMTARGFSGFELDEETTCNKIVLEYQKEGLPSVQDIDYSVVKPNGDLKKYMEPYDYIRQYFSKPMGRALYYNDLEDFFLLGSRGFGKSFFMGQAVLLHAFLFDGELYYEQKEEKTKVELFIGSGLSDKSSDFVSKFFIGLRNLPGKFKFADGTEDQHPFYKNTAGSIARPPGILYHKYKVKTSSGWKDYEGSFIKHGVFTKENPDAAAGGRLLYIIVEEVGLLENLFQVHGSNQAAQNIDGKLGISIYIGTGGNVEKIVEASIMFNDAPSFGIQSFDNVYEDAGNKIGMFMPYHYARNDFKDENGNTNLQAVHEFIMKDRMKRLLNKKASFTIDYYVMSYPIFPSEMFLSKRGGSFPVNELRKRLSQVKTNGQNVKEGVAVELFFDATKGVDYKINTLLKPLDIFKPKNKYEDPEGCIVIYEFPKTIDGQVPKDMYILGYDPYSSDNQSSGESLGAVYVVKTYNYAMSGYGYSEIVASYVGKAYEGYNAFNENVEKLAMFYGSPYEGIFFENNEGNHVVEYFRKRNKLWMLCKKPKYVLSTNDTIHSDRTVTYGYNIGGGRGGSVKRQAIGYLRDWLLETRTKTDKGEDIRNMHLINDKGLLEELLAFNYEDNFDRVMGLLGAIIGLREKTEVLKKEDLYIPDYKNPLEFLVNNPLVYGTSKIPTYR